MNKFKVGNIIKGIDKDKYNFTNTDMTKAVVLSVCDDEFITIRVIEHLTYPSAIDTTYTVESKYFALVEPEKSKPIIIYQNGSEVVALDKNTGKKGIAKCSKSDTFDFHTGAKLAFERLIEPYKGHLIKSDGGDAGTIGTKTKYVDVVGKRLCVGDVVKSYKNSECFGEDYVVEWETNNNGDIKSFIMGIESCCNNKTGEIKNGWKILKIKDHTELVNGETHGSISAKL